jgi:beta-glucosidase
MSDWAITNDCPAACRNGADPGVKPGPRDIGMPWGVEELSKQQRFAKAILAGADQLGGSDQSEIIVADVRKGLLPEKRVRDAARRILVQKFELGLFEQPYVEEDLAKAIAGNAEFVREGQSAQAKAVVLLQNNTMGNKPLLPLSAGKKLYLYGIDGKTAEKSWISGGHRTARGGSCGDPCPCAVRERTSELLFRIPAT